MDSISSESWSSRLAEPDRCERRRRRQRLYIEDAAVRSQAAIHACDQHAGEEEIRACREVGARELCPDEAGGEEAVVEALILRQGRGGLGLLGAHAEDAPRARAPEEHLEHQDVHVQECNEEDEEFRGDDHRVTVYADPSFAADRDHAFI